MLLPIVPGKKIKTARLVVNGQNGWIRQMPPESPVTIHAGPFGNFHLVTVGKPVSHDVFSCVAIDAPEAPFGMNIPGQVVIIQPMGSGFRLSPDQRGTENVMVIMLKKSFIVGAHMVLVMAVKALFVGNLSGPGVFDRIAGLGF